MGAKVIEFPHRPDPEALSKVGQHDTIEFLALERHFESVRCMYMKKYYQIQAALESGAPVEKGIHTAVLVRERFEVSDWAPIEYTRLIVR